jgi:hypothetical protein
MRINVYSQELTKVIELVSKTADTGITYFGVRMYLASPDILHHTEDDNDQSAITFWLPNNKTFSKDDLAEVFSAMSGLVLAAPEEN